MRDQYPGLATTAPYVGRSGWNSVRLEGTIPDDEVRELVDASYEAVVSALRNAGGPLPPDNRLTVLTCPIRANCGDRRPSEGGRPVLYPPPPPH